MQKSNSFKFRSLMAATIVAMTIISSSANAADAARPKAYFEPRLMRMPNLHVDENTYTKGTFESGFGDAEHAFDSNLEAAKRFSSYLENARLSNYLLWGTMASSIAFVVADTNNWHLPKRERFIASNTLFFGGLATSVYFASRSIIDLSKAMNIYNGFETTARPDSGSMNLSLVPVINSETTESGTSTGGGLGVSLSF